ncbi:GntR family transcriptional regulator [Aminithiophilus ramosus]|uniref:GntR family transcriptional regulator n=2 Tax=Synergistales TaxID=649776 RepID=A0A9Q7AI64_9BACT|nr:GntR family transcriptional regulator [Aminithiophilus ramosus]QTX33394.1 GntR family transcriptional regulator [Aminithiophilus ramosus]QVL36859.1 GntR family transcriptional regulator [Synergistota bacterium]
MATAEERAHQKIVELILSRAYAPGDRLVETELAQSLGLSRTPIRNAMRQLVAEGLLEAQDGKGCYVPRLTPEDMRDIFKARIYLEGKAALEAATARTERDVDYVRDLLEREKEHYRAGRLHEYTEINKAFHLVVASMARNPYIEKFARQTFWRSELYIFFFDRFYVPEEPEKPLRDPSQSRSCQEHERIVEAISAGDGTLAEVTMKAHILTTYSLMTRRMPLIPTTGLQPARYV